MGSSIAHNGEPLPDLRPMTPDDVGPASEAILAGGWGDRRGWFAFAVASPHVRTFIATAPDGSVVGTGVVTINGPVAWIGTIWVADSWRGRGLGRRLTEAPMEAAEAAGCTTMVLVATDAGRPLYERLGFAVETEYVIVEAPGLAADTSVTATRIVRPWRPDDVDAAAALDARVTGEDRRHLLAAFATPSTAKVVVDADDRPTGFVVRAPWGGGATIAPDPEDAAALLTARRLASGPDGRVRAGLLSENASGMRRLEDAGWIEIWRAPRMIRGTPLVWEPDGIWGQYNHAVG